jgi:DNA-binding NtrC family response regulator
MLRHRLSLNPDYEVSLFRSGAECLKNLYKKPGMVSLDYTLPDISGMDVIRKLLDYDPELPVVVVSGQEDISTAVSMLKEGAYDYIVKDEDTPNRLWNTIRNLRERMALKQQITELKREIGKKYEFGQVIKGSSPAIKAVFQLMEKAVQTNITVSITGETGTGKDLVAKAIHYNSPRGIHPFVAINVTAIPRELIESEMFGYEKGAFTGANTRKAGKFEAAGKGTIFLDEVAEMELNMQAKLLRVLQEKEFSRVGGNESLKVEARLIVASNKSLAEEVRKGNFREDLYYRLLGLPIELPPLRFRGNDILILAKHFIGEFCKENGIEAKSISAAAQEKLLKYPFPGNIRELKAMVELATVMANEHVIGEDDINFSASHHRTDFLLEENTLEGYERLIIAHYLRKYNHNVKLVAEKLGIGKSTIYRLLKTNPPAEG